MKKIRPITHRADLSNKQNVFYGMQINRTNKLKHIILMNL